MTQKAKDNLFMIMFVIVWSVFLTCIVLMLDAYFEEHYRVIFICVGVISIQGIKYVEEKIFGRRITITLRLKEKEDE